MGKHTNNRLALVWLQEVLPPGYKIILLGRTSIRIDKEQGNGELAPVLTTDNPARLESFMRDFFMKTIPARVLPVAFVQGIGSRREEAGAGG